MSSRPHLTDAVETLLRAGDDPLPRAAGAHPAGCLQPEKERQKRGRPAMTTTPLRCPFAPHPPNPLLPQGEKEASGRSAA